jgi:hypothetical protein
MLGGGAGCQVLIGVRSSGESRSARPRRVVRWWLERDEFLGGLVGGAEVEAEDGVALECLG